MVNPYSCHSKPRKAGYWAQSMHVGNEDCPPFLDHVWIADTMSQDCQYRKDVTNDPRCEGCTCP